jgi:uncharacterized protein YdgA (DUF945 family)
MKKAAVVVIIVLLLALCGPFATGMLTQSSMEQRIEQRGSNAMFTSEIVSYERGWYQSQARLEFGLSEIYLEQLGAARGDSEMLVWLTQRIPVIVDIVHGPVTLAGGLNLGMARVTARPDPASPTVAQIEQLLGLPYLFEFRGRAGFGTGFEFDADVPPVD